MTSPRHDNRGNHLSIYLPIYPPTYLHIYLQLEPIPEDHRPLSLNSMIAAQNASITTTTGTTTTTTTTTNVPPSSPNPVAVPIQHTMRDGGDSRVPSGMSDESLLFYKVLLVEIVVVMVVALVKTSHLAMADTTNSI